MSVTTFHLTTEVIISAADERATFAMQPHQAPASYTIRVAPQAADEYRDHKTGVTHWIKDDFEPDQGVSSFEDAVTVAWARFIQQLDQYFGEQRHVEGDQ